MKRNVLGLMLGLVCGVLFNVGIAHAQGQSNKITANGGFNLCVDAPGVSTLAAAQALGVTIDGTAVSGVTWTGSADPFTAQIPISQLAASYRTNGVHTISVAFTSPSGSGVVLADGSTLQPSPGTPLSVTYEVVAQPVTPSPSNPRWKVILGTLASAIGVVLGLKFFHVI